MPRLPLIFALLAALALSLPGIDWGVPSDERAKLLFSSLEEQKAAIEAARGFVEEGDWKRSHVLADDSEVIRHRTTFNLIRTYGPDEQDIIKPLAGMRPKKLDFNPHRFAYPALVTYVVGGAVGLAALLGQVTVSSNLEYYFLNPWEFGKIYIVGRLVIVVFSLLTIWVTWLLASALYGRRAGGLAAVMLAVAPLWAIDAHILKVDIPGTFFIVACVYASWLHLEKGSLRSLGAAGVLAGLAAGSKYNFGIVILAPVSVAIMTAWRAPKRLLVFAKAMGILFVLSLAGFIGSNPYIVLSFTEFLQDFKYAAGAVGANAIMDGVGPLVLFYPMHAMPVSLGGPLYATSIAGFLMILFRPRRGDVVAAAFVLPFAFSIVALPVGAAAYLLPLFPFFAICSGVALDRFMENIKPAAFGRTVAFLAIAASIGISASEVSLFTRPDTRYQAGQWVDRNVPAGATIGLMGTPLTFHTPPLNANKYELAILDSPGVLAEKMPDVIVVSDYWMVYYRRVGKTAARGDVLAAIEAGPYEVAAVVKEAPSFLGVERPRPAILPHDWLHPSPPVTIYRRLSPAPPQS